MFFKKWREKRKAKKALEKDTVNLTSNKVVDVEDDVVKTEPVKTSKKLEESAQIQKKEKVVDSKVKEEKIAKYHVSQNKVEDSEHFKKWRVRKEGSKKTIKFFNTQLEAITFAEELAEKAGSSVVIHKVDGSIRKQDYTKK